MKVQKVYATREVSHTVHGGAVVLGEYVYVANGAHVGRGGPLTCMELKSGKIAWKGGSGRLDNVWCLLAAEDRLYCRLQGGEVALVEASPDGYRERGRFLPPTESKEPARTVPVLAGGKLYLRDQDFLLCYDVRAARPTPAIQGQDK